jgi:hypothetical protein
MRSPKLKEADAIVLFPKCRDKKRDNVTFCLVSAEPCGYVFLRALLMYLLIANEL